MTFDLALVIGKIPAVLHAAGITLFIWAAGTLAGILIGFLVAALRRYGPFWLSLLLGACVETLRGTPFLIQLFLLYYGGPYVGISLEPFPAGLLALAVYAAAYYSEIFRGGFEAVPAGHVEAAECVGLTRLQIIRRIIGPEMTMLVLPAVVNMAIVLIKETAVLSIITVPELTLVVSAIGSQNYAFVEALFLLALVYWGLVEATGALGRAAERRLSKYRF